MIPEGSIVVSGSIAYDHLLFHDGSFSELPGAADSNFNLSMVAARMRREFGGCAGNIAYTLNMLQPGAGTLVGAVGHDIGSYSQWLRQNGISDAHVLEVREQHTAQAFIVTDKDNNQMTMFHPGAMDQAHLVDVSSFAGARLAIVTPDGYQAMLDHCSQFHQAGVPFVFDPGQATGMFSGEQLLQMLRQGSYVIANEHEWKLLLSATGMQVADIAKLVQAAIMTKGEQGAEIFFADGSSLQVAPVPARRALDPTGCGDSWRAVMLYGLARGLDWQATARLASLVSSLVVEHNGTQNHSFSRQELAARYNQQYGEELDMGT